MIQALERRLLLANIGIVNGILRIEGTPGDDSIALAEFRTTRVQVFDGGNVAFTASLSSFRAVAFAGGDGNDLITLGRVNKRALLVGGAGDDSLSASQGDLADTLLGEDGNDYLFGGGGDDTLTGGVGRDVMIGGTGRDRINLLSNNSNDDFAVGGDGIDTVSAADYPNSILLEVGNADPDQVLTDDTVLGDFEVVIGTDFDDTLSVVSGRSVSVFGGAGNDTITTGRGNDTITGGAGTDLLSSAGGNDFFDSADTETDTLTGGSGVDTATADAFDVLNSVTAA